MISSNVFALVSGTQKQIKIAPEIQTPAKRNMHPCKLSVSFKNGVNLTITNANIQMSDMHTETPNSFNDCGMISAVITYGNDDTAHEPINKISEKLASGIQPNVSTL